MTESINKSNKLSLKDHLFSVNFFIKSLGIGLCLFGVFGFNNNSVALTYIFVALIGLIITTMAISYRKNKTLKKYQLTENQILQNLLNLKNEEKLFYDFITMLSSNSGDNLYKKMATNLTKQLDVKWAIISKIDPNNDAKFRTISLVKSGELQENFTYDSEGTPCATVYGSISKVYEDQLQNSFPDDVYLPIMDVHSYIGVPIFYANGEPLGIVAILDDKKISDVGFKLKILEVLAKRLSSEFSNDVLNTKLDKQRLDSIETSRLSSIGEMAAGIAHEINNPLSIIRGYASMLKNSSDKITPEKKVELLEKIIRTTSRIARIVKSLRIVARDGEREPFSEILIEELLEDTLPVVEDKLKNQKIQFDVTTDFSNERISCNVVKVSQCLVNLLSNAMHAVETIEKPIVKLIINKDDKFFNIIVEDNGPGVPNELKNKIMNPFFTTKEIGKGTGLGLSLTKAFMEEHGGNFYLDDSTGATRFVMAFPIKLVSHTKNNAA